MKAETIYVRLDYIAMFIGTKGSCVSSLFLLTISSDKKWRGTEGPWRKLGVRSGVTCWESVGRQDPRMAKIHKDTQVEDM